MEHTPKLKWETIQNINYKLQIVRHGGKMKVIEKKDTLEKQLKEVEPMEVFKFKNSAEVYEPYYIRTQQGMLQLTGKDYADHTTLNPTDCWMDKEVQVYESALNIKQ